MVTGCTGRNAAVNQASPSIPSLPLSRSRRFAERNGPRYSPPDAQDRCGYYLYMNQGGYLIYEVQDGISLFERKGLIYIVHMNF